jgi:hypothetical protein
MGLAGAAPFDVCLLGMPISAHPVIDLSLSFIFCDPIFFLDLPDKLFVLAIDDIDVIVGQFTPTLPNGTFHLLPLALQLI